MWIFSMMLGSTEKQKISRHKVIKKSNQKSNQYEILT